MALLFAAGGLAALPALRHRVEPLLALPRRFARMIAAVLAKGPSVPKLALVIFLFNGCAMFCYMMTGLIPWLPAAVVFLTGLNVVAAGMIGKETSPPPERGARLTKGAALCGLLTFLLELPCFWFAMAMGWTMTPRLPELLRGADAGGIKARIAAYATVLLPLLALSAAAEAYAVLTSRRAPKHYDGGETHE